ncbi:sigma-70 family RNA polymerase sigma factor [Myxococcota bacterium]|nr:sigma-70 family RNA polymerase sigma factor [Myxococcota bacterium]
MSELHGAADPEALVDEGAPERDLSSDVVEGLVESHRELLAFVQRRVKNRALAEDLLQDAFVRGIEHGAELRDDTRATAWFHRMLRNAVVDHHRRRGASERALEAFARELDVDASLTAEVEDAACRCITRLADTLKPDYAAALRRIDVDGVSVKDFAAEAGISASNAGVRVFRARKALAERLKRACGTCADHGCLDCQCGGDGGDGACA